MLHCTTLCLDDSLAVLVVVFFLQFFLRELALSVFSKSKRDSVLSVNHTEPRQVCLSNILLAALT